MGKDLKLSEYLQDYINTLEWERERDVPVEEQKEALQARNVIKIIVDDIISSRETLTDSKLAGIEKLINAEPELTEELLDERFTRELVDAIPGYVRRTMSLSRLEGSQSPSHITNGYLREAVRTYVLGLPQASVALSRAAMEQALKEKLGYQSTSSFVIMNELLDEAEEAQVINQKTRRLARKIANEANSVLHKKPTSVDTAFDVLVMLRTVLQHIYSGNS